MTEAKKANLRVAIIASAFATLFSGIVSIGASWHSEHRIRRATTVQMRTQAFTEMMGHRAVIQQVEGLYIESLADSLAHDAAARVGPPEDKQYHLSEMALLKGLIVSFADKSIIERQALFRTAAMVKVSFAKTDELDRLITAVYDPHIAEIPDRPEFKTEDEVWTWFKACMNGKDVYMREHYAVPLDALISYLSLHIED